MMAARFQTYINGGAARLFLRFIESENFGMRLTARRMITATNYCAIGPYHQSPDDRIGSGSTFGCKRQGKALLHVSVVVFLRHCFLSTEENFSHFVQIEVERLECFDGVFYRNVRDFIASQ